MLTRIYGNLISFLAQRLFGKKASVWWSWTDDKPSGFYIAVDNKTMLTCIKSIKENTMLQMKRKPGKVIPFRRKGEGINDSE